MPSKRCVMTSDQQSENGENLVPLKILRATKLHCPPSLPELPTANLNADTSGLLMKKVVDISCQFSEKPPQSTT